MVAVDENLDILLQDVRRIFSGRISILSNQITELRVSSSGIAIFRGDAEILVDGNVTAMLRFLKSRGGADMITAR